MQRLVAGSHAKARADTLATQIRENEIGRLEDETNEEFIERLIATENVGRNELSRPVFENTLRPILTRANNDRGVVIKREADDRIVNLFVERATAADTEEDMQQLLELMREIQPLSDLSEQERQLEVFEDAVRTAANEGLVDKFERIVKNADRLPGAFVSEQRFKAESRQLRRIRLTEQQAIQEIREAHLLQPENTEQEIRSGVETGVLQPAPAALLLKELTGITEQKRKRDIVAQQKSLILEAAITASLNTSQTGGLNGITRDIPFIVEGEIQEYSKEELKEDVINRHVDSILQNQDKPEDVRITEAFTWLSRNKAVYPPFAALMGSAAALPLADLTGEELPPIALQGFQLFSAMKEQSADLLRSHIEESATRSFLEDWRTTNRLIAKGDIQAAAVYAKEANKPDRRDRFSQNFNNKVMQAAVRDVTKRFLPEFLGGGDIVKNEPDVRATINKLAELQMKRLGISHKDAATNAAETLNADRQVILGWWVDTSARPLPPDALEIVEFAAQRYAEKFGDTEGLTAADLTVIPSSDGSIWQIHRMDMGIAVPVENVNDSVFTPGQFSDFRELRRRKELAEVLANREIVTGLEKFKAKVEEGERKLGSLAKSALAILATGVRPEVPPEEMKQRRKDVIRMIENVGLSGTLKDFSVG